MIIIVDIAMIAEQNVIDEVPNQPTCRSEDECSPAFPEKLPGLCDIYGIELLC